MNSILICDPSIDLRHNLLLVVFALVVIILPEWMSIVNNSI